MQRLLGAGAPGYLAALFLLVVAPPVFAEAEIQTHKVALDRVAIDISASGLSANETATLLASTSGQPAQQYQSQADSQGNIVFSDVLFPESGRFALDLSGAGGASASASQRVIPGWVSILPPFFAIALALLVRSVLPALVIGIWIGAMSLISFTPKGAFVGVLDGFQVYVRQSLADADHASIILFTLMIGGMVGIVTRVGGMSAIVRLIVSKAKTAIAGQVSIWAMGLVIFFDDYGNTLVVGNTARPLSDKLKISREKLAYIVDSTASPVACIAVATTWIGYQVGLIADSLGAISAVSETAYSVFLKSIAYSFYPILAILFVFAIAVSGRDFGPMVKAEQRARKGSGSNDAKVKVSVEDNLEAKPGIKERAANALIPIGVLIAGLIGGLFATGSGDTVAEIIGNADAYKAMMWASVLGAFAAGALAVAQRLLSLAETIDAWYAGLRAMMFAMIILILAWAMSGVTKDLHTADYLVSILADQLPMQLLPVTVFVLSAITAFSTGTAWGTMGILMPLIIPLTWAIINADASGLDHMHIMYSAIACNLAGAVWGDHCSPISDTTVLSSMASGCDHIEHVRTQLPYALVVGAVAALIGTIPAGYGLPWWIGLLAGAAILIAILFSVGTVTTPRGASPVPANENS